jgi:exoribonuclease-2
VTEFEGQIWATQDNDEIHFICTTKRIKKKILALNEKGQKLRLSEDKLLWQHPSAANGEDDWKNKLATIKTTVETLYKDIDIEFLWESALELEISDVKEFADLYYGGEITTEHLVALWHIVADNKLYFKRKRQNWDPRTIEQVEEIKTQRQRENARIKAQALAQGWLLEVARIPIAIFPSSDNFKLVPISDDIIPFVERLESWLRGDTDKEAEELIKQTAEPLKLSPRELVFEILQKIGRLSLDADRYIIIAGLKPEFSAAINKIAESVPLWMPNDNQNITEVLFSIDDEETREVDDALSIERDGLLWKLTIAIADPASVIHRNEMLDKEAMRRGTTVYLPTQTVLMLPERISCDIASLTAEQVRSSLVIRIWLDERGKISKSNINREAIRVLKRLHYSDADSLIAEGDNEMAQHLRDLFSCAKLLQKQRIASGAFQFQRPEYKMQITAGTINVTMIKPNSPSRLLVAEMMIFANHIAATYASKHELPFIYRIQSPPQQPITPEMTKDPLALYKIRKFIGRSSLSLHPSGHSGLGLSMYTQMSSPLRRFADLVMQRQLMAHLEGETLPYDDEELFEVLETAERTSRESRTAENEAKKRWLMQYLKINWSGKKLEVMIVDELKGGYKVEILPWGADGYLATSKSFEIGKTTEAVLDRINIKAGNTRLKVK